MNGHIQIDATPQSAVDKQAVDYEVMSYLIQLYGTEQGQRLHEYLRHLAAQTAGAVSKQGDSGKRWSPAEAILICYGDGMQQEGRMPLQALADFSNTYLQGIISAIHVLPFFPSSSDDGFAIMDYERVRADLGDWADVQQLGESFDLMVDLVINHCSREHLWVTDYITNEAPGKDYFHELEDQPQLGQVLRPRNSPLLTEINTRSGIKKLWTTFSEDQIDLNFANPDVLLEFVKILFFYARMGARYIRLDAVAYLWKRLGTTCMSLPETHMVVRILRGLIDVEELPLTLITETNVPHAENVSYFGEANEAHLVYQFSLAPLLLYSYIAGDSRALVEWTRSLAAPPAGCSYFNFIASHDGIGLRPLEGLLPDSEIAHLIDIVHERGGFASMRSADSGQERAYELNISLFSAFGGDPEDLNAYVGAHQLLLAYQGVPGLYLNALLGTANDYQQMEVTGRMRSINRGHWQLHDATAVLQDTDSHHAKVFHALTSSLRLRGEQSAFAPAAAQTFIDGSNEYLMFLRHDKYQRILVIASFALRSQALAWPEGVLETYQAVVKDLLSGQTVDCSTAINIDPYQVMWLELA